MIYHYSGMSIRVALTMTAVFFLLSVMQVGAVDPCTVTTPLTGGTQHCSSNASGTIGGYTWTIWSSGSGGCMTPYGVGAAFKATWNNSGDFLSREGLQWNETKTYDQYGTISADYAYTKTGSGGGWSDIGIYGWSNNPLVEYYIVDDWYGSSPYTGGYTLKGSFTVDGGTYNVYTHTQTNQPSIHGTATFPQFFSIRQTARQCGHISITEHFNKWASLGMTLGKMYEAKLLVEVGGGSGSIDYTMGTVVAGATSVSFLPGTSQGRRASLDNGKGCGVLSLISLNGAVVRTARQNGSEPANVSTDNLARGVYLLQFQGDGKAPVLQSLLLK